jgi:hypothetical protein
VIAISFHEGQSSISMPKPRLEVNEKLHGRGAAGGRLSIKLHVIEGFDGASQKRNPGNGTIA